MKDEMTPDMSCVCGIRPLAKCSLAAVLLLCALLLTLKMGATVQAQSVTSTPSGTTATVLYNTNLRAGPGAAQAIVGNVQAGQVIQVVASSPDGNWVQLTDGTWLATFFVKPTGQAPATPTRPRLLVATAPATRTVSTPRPLTPTTTTTSVISTPTGTATVRATQSLIVTPSTTGTVGPLITSVLTTTRLHATPTPTKPAGATVLRNANLRAGPGTNYAVVGSLRANDVVDLQARTGDGTWLQLGDGSWIAAFLVEQNATANSSTLPTVAPTVIVGIPTIAPTATAIPTSTSQSTASQPETALPTAAAPVAPTTAPTAPPTAGNSTFVVTRRRLWNPWENGGSMDGPSVHCGQGRTLVVNVLDENGNRINGVAIQAAYGAQEIHVSGAQGKGDGVVEFVLGGGQDVKVIRDADGSPVNSEVARGLSTDPRGIDQESLMSAGYCQDDESCRTFVNNLSCIGHFSWTVTFERRR